MTYNRKYTLEPVEEVIAYGRSILTGVDVATLFRTALDEYDSERGMTFKSVVSLEGVDYAVFKLQTSH